MNRTLTLVVFALVAGCAGRAPTRVADTDGGTTDPLQQLEADTGQTWTVRWRTDLHTPALLEGRTPPLATTGPDAERAGADFLRRYGALYAMGPDDDVVAEDSDTDELGMTHARFQERVDNVPVWGGELITHFDADGALVRVNGRYVPILSPVPDAATSADQARALAANGARAAYPAVDPDAFTTAAPKLYLYPVGPVAVKLAWRVEVDVADDRQTMTLEAFVDAVDGSIVHLDETTAYLDGSGVGVLGDRQALVVAPNGASYILEDATRGVPPTRTYTAGGKTRLPGIAVRSKDVLKLGQRRGRRRRRRRRARLRGAGVGLLRQRTRPPRLGRQEQGRARDGALWIGLRLRLLRRQPARLRRRRRRRLRAAVGRARHRRPRVYPRRHRAHGAPRHGRRKRRAQRGALRHLRLLHRRQLDARRGDLSPGGQAGALRDLADPHASNDPASMLEYVQTTADNGGVHLNSTIVSHTAWLMARKLPPATVEKILVSRAVAIPARLGRLRRRRRRHRRRGARSRRRRRDRGPRGVGRGRRDRGRCPVLDDEAELRRFGYAQQLRRGMSAFGNFALSFSIISILTGAVSLYGYGLGLGGPFEMTIGWPLVSLMTLAVAVSLAELASAYPTAGALYHWATILGGPRVGWWTAWLNLIGQVAVLAGVDYAFADFLREALGLADDPLHLHVLAILCASCSSRTGCSTTSASGW